MTRYLTVPIRVDALRLTTPREAVGPTLDIARAPWFGTGADGVARDHFPQTANVAPAVRNDPMAPNNRFLSEGVHLHWALPDALTRGTTTKTDADSYVERNGLWFPQAPNRWLVVRRVRASTTAAWLVESDFVHPWGSGVDSVAYPLPPRPDRPYPFARVGRRIPLPDAGDAAQSAGEPDALRDLDAPLTAIGPLDPTFAALYTACHSVFGMHDEQPLADDAVYDVVGWYARPADDPFTHWLQLDDPSAEGIADVLAIAGDERSADQLTDLAAESRRAAEVLFGERTQWTLPDGTEGIADCEGLLFAGSVTVTSDASPATPPAVQAPVSVGTSPQEALSALLANLDQRPSLEAELEALGLRSTLKDHTLDVGPKLAELRHDLGFTAERDRTIWELRPAAAASSALDPSTQRTRRRNANLPSGLAHLINVLNTAQEAADRAEDELASYRQQVFTDWQLYMLATYREDDTAEIELDVDRIRDVLLPASMRACATAEQEARRHLTVVADHVADLGAAVISFNTTAAAHDAIELVPTTGPRFWRPNDPSIAIAPHEALIPTVRHGADHRAREDQKLECATADVATVPSADMSRRQISTLRAAIASGGTDAFEAIAAHDGSVAWHPILVEWEASVRPVVPGTNQTGGARRFDPDVVTRYFELAEDACDLAPRDPTHYDQTGRPSLVSGRSVLTSHGADLLLDDLDAYLAELDDEIERLSGAGPAIAAAPSLADGGDERTFLRDTLRTRADDLAPALAQLQSSKERFTQLREATSERVGPGARDTIVTFSLGGLMDRLLMKRTEPQLPIADPLGFPEDQARAAEVAALLADAHRLSSPDIRSPFLPLSGAGFENLRGRVIDSFGQFTTWEPGASGEVPAVTTAQTMRSVRPGQDPRIGQTVLPLRSSQTARLDFRWLAADRLDVESNDHPATTPLCGWLVPNDFDQAVLVYDAAGALLGTLDEHGVWHRAPGDDGAPAGPGLIANDHLSRLVTWMVSRDEPDFVTQLLSTFDSALRQIDPTDYASHDARALLVGRPIAVARARVGLSLRGVPERDSSVAALAQRLAGNEPSDHGFGAVAFPIRIGEHGQLNDGLVGYFVDAGDANRHDVLHAPQSSGQQPSPSIDVYDEASGTPLNLRRSFDDPPTDLTVLLDPRSPVHASCGILPRKAVRIPRDQYEPSMNSLQVLFSGMPVLTSPDRVELPLPSGSTQRWSFLALERGRWRETPADASITLDELRRAVPGSVSVTGAGAVHHQPPGATTRPGTVSRVRADLLWERLLEHGWIEPAPGGEATLLRPTRRDLGDGFDPGEVEQLLTKLARRIEPVERHATFGPRAVVREGWMKLTPAAHDRPVADDKPAAPTGDVATIHPNSSPKATP